MTQHTPGPWTLGSGDAQGPNGVFVGEGDNRKAVAMLTGTFDPRNGYAVDEGDDGWPHERTANAALIAAAPELLEALKAVVLAVANNPTGGPWEQVAAAIAAAEGPGDTQSC